MSDVDFDELRDVPEFEPGWPDLLPLGMLIGRVTVTQRGTTDEDSDPEDDHVTWRMHLGTAEEQPRLAFIGELVAHSPYAVGAATVILPFVLRDEEPELTESYVDGLLQQYGRWVSSIMYDHGATHLRAAHSGMGIPLKIPYATPEVKLV